jgi:hemoglobin/transferrin/lactoferrin receptor protein
MFENGRVVAAYQNIGESRHQRKTGSTSLQHRDEEVMVLSLNADFEKKYGEKLKLGYGLEAVYNDVTSTANTEDIETGAIGPLDTRYPDGGSTMSTGAVYITGQEELKPEKLFLNVGVRFTAYALKSVFVDTTFFNFPFDEAKQDATNLSGSAGLVYLPGNDWKLSLSLATGFRAPNVDDMAKIFDGTGGAQVTLPNADLKPETTINSEVGISKLINKKVRIETVGFYTYLQDAIASKPYTYEGSSTIIYNGDTSAVFANQNVNDAFIYGVSLNLAADITHNFSITSSLNYTYGRYHDDSLEVPLDHIAPTFGITGFNLNLKKFRTEFFVMYSGWKRLSDYSPSGEDNLAYATPEGMPAWYTLNLRAAYQFNKHIQLQAALENILDQNYRVFASGISAPGRNLSITLRAAL